MREEFTRSTSITVLLLLVVLALVAAVVAFVPLVRCPNEYCYNGYREALRCPNVVTGPPYPESVRRMYEAQVTSRRCDRCTSGARSTLMQLSGWRLPWEPTTRQR